MRKVGLFALITALTSLIANFAKADTVVTSKTYVDAKISSSADISSTSTTTAPNEKAVYDAISSATSATSNLLTQVISDADTSHAPSGDAVYDALADKQNKIDSYNSATTGPSVLIDSTQSGVVGKRAILDMNAVDGLAWDDIMGDSTLGSMIMDAGAVGSVIGAEESVLMDALAGKQNKLGGDSSSAGKVVTATANSGVVTYTAIKTAVDSSSDLITAGAVNSALANKQDKILANDWEDLLGDPIPGVVISNGDNGVVEQRMILDLDNLQVDNLEGVVDAGYDDGGQGGITDAIHSSSVDSTDVNNAVPTTTTTIAIANAAARNRANNLLTQVISDADTTHAPSGNAVYDALDSKQDKLGGVGHAGKVVTATANEGVVTYTTIKTSVDSSSDLITAGAVNSALDTKQNKIDSTGTAPFYAAGGSVVTTTDSAGVVGERFIWTAEAGDETTWYINSFYPDSATQAAVRNAIPTVEAVEAGLYNKQNKLGGSGSAGKVVTATANVGEVTYTTIKTSVDSSSDLITAGAVKTYADSKVSAASSISTTSTTTAPNEKAVYDAINTVQSAVDTLASCTHTCADTACELITISCVNLAS